MTRTSTRLLFSTALASYLANCALGTLVATRTIDTSRVRWVHHTVYVSTVVWAAAAGSSLLWGRGDGSGGAGWMLLPAAVPLAVIPVVSARSAKHPLIALTAAPFFVASTITAWR